MGQCPHLAVSKQSPMLDRAFTFSFSPACSLRCGAGDRHVTCKEFRAAAQSPLSHAFWEAFSRSDLTLTAPYQLIRSTTCCPDKKTNNAGMAMNYGVVGSHPSLLGAAIGNRVDGRVSQPVRPNVGELRNAALSWRIEALDTEPAERKQIRARAAYIGNGSSHV